MSPDRRKRLATVAALLAVLVALWWTERGRVGEPSAPAPPPELRAPRRQPSDRAAPPPASEPAPSASASEADPRGAAPPTSAEPTPDLSSIRDPDERAAVARVAKAIDAGGPFPYRKDGSVFENREKRLPPRRPGYWREYTVPTAEEDDRGARRLVAGAQREIYYSRDHYRTFLLIRAALDR
jgi:ribonuclease T1